MNAPGVRRAKLYDVELVASYYAIADVVGGIHDAAFLFSDRLSERQCQRVPSVWRETKPRPDLVLIFKDVLSIAVALVFRGANVRVQFVIVRDLGTAGVSQPIAHLAPHLCAFVRIVAFVDRAAAELDPMHYVVVTQFMESIMHTRAVPPAHVDKDGLWLMLINQLGNPTRNGHLIAISLALVNDAPSVPALAIDYPSSVLPAAIYINAEHKRSVILAGGFEFTRPDNDLGAHKRPG